MGDAIRIDQRLQALFAGRRESESRPKHPEGESPREIERRAVERLYGERSTAVVRAEPEEEKGR